MTKNLKKTTFTGFLWLLAGSSSQTVLQVLVISILARLVTPEEFGVIAIAVIFLGFSKIFSQLGMGAAIVQKKEITESHVRTAYTTSLVIGTIFCILALLLSKNIAIYFEMPELERVLYLVSCIFIVDSFISVSQSLLQRNLKMKYYALSELISYVISFGILGVSLAYLGYGLYALVYAYILQAILRAIMVSYLEPHSVIPFFNKRSFLDLFFFGSSHTVAKIANYFAGQGDKLVVGKMIDADALGYYSRAYQLMVAPIRLIGQSLNIVLFPALSSVQSDLHKVRNAFYRSSEIVALASLIISAILFVNAREIVLILLGDNWLDVIIPFQILAIGTVFRMSTKISDSLVKALGDIHRRAVIQIIYASCIFLFSFIGHYWGINGVAIGVLSAVLVNFILMSTLSLRQFKDKGRKFLYIHVKPLLFSVVVFLIAYGVLSVIRSFNLSLIITEIIYVAIVFGAVLILILRLQNWLGISKEIDEVFKAIRKKKK